MTTESHDLILDSAGQVGRNAAMLIAANALSGLLGLSYAIILTRVLGPQSFGIYAGAVAAASIAGIVMNYGPALLITREVAQRTDTDSAIVSQVTFSFILPLLVSIAAILLLAWRAPDAALRIAIPIAILAVAGRSLVRLYCAVFEGKQNMIWTALSGLALSALPLMALSLMFLPGFRNPRFPLWLEGITAALVVFGLAAGLRGAHHVVFHRPALRDLLRFVRQAFPFWAIIGASILVLQSDVFILSWTRPAAETGLYRSAMNLVLLLEVIPALLGTALYPAIAQHVHDTEVLRAFVWRAFKISFLLGIGIALALAAVARPLVVLAYGGAYREAGDILVRLTPLTALKYPLYILSLVLYAARKELRVAPFIFCGAVLNVGLNVALIPRYGAPAAAAATVAANALLLIFCFALVTRELAPVAIWKILPAVAVGAAVDYGIVYVLRPWNVWAGMIIGAAAYLGILVLGKAVDALDVAAVRRIAHPRRTQD